MNKICFVIFKFFTNNFSPPPFTLTSKLPTPPQRGSPLAARAQRAEPALRAGSARIRRCQRHRRNVAPAPAGRGLGGGGQFYIVLQNHIKNNYWISWQRYLLKKIKKNTIFHIKLLLFILSFFVFFLFYWFI